MKIDPAGLAAKTLPFPGGGEDPAAFASQLRGEGRLQAKALFAGNDSAVPAAIAPCAIERCKFLLTIQTTAGRMLCAKADLHLRIKRRFNAYVKPVGYMGIIRKK